MQERNWKCGIILNDYWMRSFSYTIYIATISFNRLIVSWMDFYWDLGVFFKVCLAASMDLKASGPLRHTLVKATGCEMGNWVVLQSLLQIKDSSRLYLKDINR